MSRVQEFDKDKFDRLILYICAKVENPANLGAVKLHKILWFSDLVSFARFGRSIAGDTFIKMPQGPFSVHVDKGIKRLERSKRLVHRQMPVYNRIQRQFFALTEPDLNGFTPEEVSIIDEMITAIALGHTASSISAVSHDRIWEVARLHETIPLNTIFSSDLADAEESTILWARNAIDDDDLRAADAAMAN